MYMQSRGRRSRSDQMLHVWHMAHNCTPTHRTLNEGCIMKSIHAYVWPQLVATCVDWLTLLDPLVSGVCHCSTKVPVTHISKSLAACFSELMFLLQGITEHFCTTCTCVPGSHNVT